MERGVKKRVNRGLFSLIKSTSMSTKSYSKIDDVVRIIITSTNLISILIFLKTKKIVGNQRSNLLREN